jgi:hypothetical protein
MTREEKKISFDLCPACKSNTIYKKDRFASLPGILFPVAPDASGQILTQPLLAYSCLNCSHIFQKEFKSDFIEKIYREYYQYYPFDDLDTFDEPYREPFEKLSDILIQKTDASLLEVGTGNEKHLKMFFDKGVSCTAVNPGVPSSARVKFIDAFYESWGNDEKFDYIVSRFNLEHVMDLDAYFDQIKRNLADEGIVIIQVPNAAQFVKSGVLNIYAHEHIHYFNTHSLRHLVERHGLQINFMSSSTDPSVLCSFSRPTSSDVNNKGLSNNNTLVDVCNIVNSSSSKIVFYGVGLSTAAIIYGGMLTDDSLEKIIYIDDNPALKGRCLPFTANAIKTFEDAAIGDAKTIILTLNEQYHGNVIDKIKSKYPSLKIIAIQSAGLIEVP